jgi:hypothetical protein
MVAGLDLPQDALPVTNIFPRMEKPNSVTTTFILQRQPVAMDRCVYVRKMVVLLVLVKTTAPTANHSAAHVIKQKSSLTNCIKELVVLMSVQQAPQLRIQILHATLATQTCTVPMVKLVDLVNMVTCLIQGLLNVRLAVF